MKQQFNVGFVTFSYGGNGGISSEVPNVREWMVPLVAEISRDPRIENVRIWNLADTPITMTRNRAVVQAREAKVDVLVMIDSDMHPDVALGQPGAKPFFQSSFDFLVDHYHKGPVAIGAPYCGPPPVECVYIFRWQNRESNNVTPDFQLEMFDRHTAASLIGIQECAALPTGLIMYDMRCFDLTEPKDETSKPWFYYEWKDKYAAEKASTEDVTQTRDLSLVGVTKLGYNPVFCNWDAWAGHWKPKCVGKPAILSASSVGHKLKDAWGTGYENTTKVVDLRPTGELKRKVELAKAFDNMGMHLVPRDVDSIHRLVSDFRSIYGFAPTVLEIGSWAGNSALTFIEAGAQSVHCVDHWLGNENDDGTSHYDGKRGDPLEVFKRNVAGMPITHTVGSSPHIAGKFEDKSFDIVYIDAEHTEEAVTQDILAWHTKAKYWVAGHDYAAFPGVKQAVDAICRTVTVDGNVWRTDGQNVHPVQAVVSRY